MKTKRWTSKRDVLKVLPERKPESHKGDFGRLLIVGGGSHYVGAPALVGLAALRSGADLVIVAAPEKTAWAVNSISPDLITLKLPCKDLEPSVIPELRSELERSTAVVVGPGLGTTSKTLDAVIEIARELKEKHPRLPTLFDADGLKALANTRDLLHGMPWILTPHVGEFKLLVGSDIPRGMDERMEHVKSTAQKLGCSILVKGHVDIIASASGDLKLNRTGNPGMSVGGTGDVLSGIVGAFLAQGNDPFNAATAGAWVCGRAGDLCLKEKGYEFIASDLIDKLPEVFKEIRRKR